MYSLTYLILIACISILLMKIWWALKNIIFLVNVQHKYVQGCAQYIKMQKKMQAWRIYN